MAFNTLEHGNIAEINRMFERFVCLVAGFAFAISETAEVDRVLNGQSLDGRSGTGRVRQNGVTDVAIPGNHFAAAANVFTIVTPETA